MTSPNILFLLADDLGWMDLSCQGSTFYETPNIDRLAARGVRFTDAYATGPVCSPTRASLLTGKYPPRVGVTHYLGGHGRGKLLEAPYTDHLPREEHSLAAALRDGGYQTWHVGKWHLGTEDYYPEHHGFDVNIGGARPGSPGKGGYFAPWTVPGLTDAPVPDGTFLDDYLTDRAIKLIEQRDTDRPFFLNLWFYLVHTPIQAKPELVEKYNAKAADMGLPMGDDALVEGERFPSEHKKDQRLVRRTAQSDPAYAAMVETIDTCVGRLIDALDHAGQLDNTLIVFTSDNGGLATAEGSPTCNYPLVEGKGWMYEGGLRVPLIVSYPGTTPAGATCSAVVNSADFYPTCLDAAGLSRIPDQHVDGGSFLEQLADPDAPLDREAIFWHYPHYGNQGGTPGGVVRAGPHKLIEFYETGRLALFHLDDDISEQHDLADDDPVRRAKLHTMLSDWRAEVEAVMPQINPDFVPWRDDPDAAPEV